MLAALLRAMVSGAHAYEPTKADPLLDLWRWSLVESLEDHVVYDAHTLDGDVYWFGVSGGLVRMDGYDHRFIPFDREALNLLDESALAFGSRQVWALSDERVLVLTHGSLLLWDSGEWRIVERSVLDVSFESTILESPDGTLWLFTRSGLWRVLDDFDGIRIVYQPARNESLGAATVDDEARFWVVSMSRQRKTTELIRFNQLADGSLSLATRIEMDVEFGLPSQTTDSLLADSEGRIWYGNKMDPSLRYFDPAEAEWHIVSKPDTVSLISSLHEADDGAIWAGADGDIFIWKNGEMRTYQRVDTGLTADPIISIFSAPDGRMCFIARLGSVHFFDSSDSYWQSYLDLNFQTESEGDTQWFLRTRGRAVSYSPRSDSWTEYTASQDIIDRVMGVHVSSDRRVWFYGSDAEAAAFSVYDGRRWRKTRLPSFAPFIAGESLMEDASGNIWVGSSGAVDHEYPRTGGAMKFRISGEGSVELVEQFSEPRFPPNIKSLAETPDGRIWLGRAGMHVYDPVNGEAERVDVLPRIATEGLEVDQHGLLWVSFRNYGAYRLKGGKWENFNSSNGLASNVVARLLQLSDGSMLAATDRGISRFDGVSWMPHAFSQDFAMTPNNGFIRQAKNGALWFNFRKPDIRSPRVNLNLQNPFRAVRYTPSTQVPETYITQYVDRVSSDGTANISWRGKDFWDETPANQLEYSYRVNGGEWSAFGARRGESLAKLKPGSYTFEVRSRDRDFNIDPTPAVVQFTVEPPFWQSPLFLGMCVITVAGIGFSIWQYVNYREKNLLAKQQHLIDLDAQKNRFLTAITHEFCTPLSAISVPVQELMKDEQDSDRREYLEIVQRNTQTMELLIDQLLDLRKIEEGVENVVLQRVEFGSLVEGWIQQIRPMAIVNTIDLQFEVHTQESGYVDPVKFEKICRNLMSNALKYTPRGGRVAVSLDRVEAPKGEQYLRFIVEDSGKGIPREYIDLIFERFYRVPEHSMTEGAGIGLNTTKELVNILGGTIEVDSPISKDKASPGTRFTVKIPLISKI